jgi:hypothetical protein
VAEDTNYLLKCVECGADFFTEGEQAFYKSKGLNMPKRCKTCREKKKARYEQINQEKEIQALLKTLPFKQIEKTDMSLLTRNNSLYIIGNGFDLMHGVPSSYYSFRDSMGRQNELRNALELYIRKEDLWADFEESLAHLDDEAMLGTVNDWMDILNVKDQFDDDFSAADFFMAAETATGSAQTIMRELPKRFRKWVSTLKPLDSEKSLEDIIAKQSTFINFNYTEFLETIYGVPKKNVWYIHGDRREKKELILGHAPGAEFEVEINTRGRSSELSKMKNQTAYDLHETAGYQLNHYYDSTTKKSNDVIKANKDRFKALSQVENIVVIGHSLSPVDYPYFKEIINCNQNATNMQWFISWYSSDDLKRISEFISNLKIMSSNVKMFRT